MIDKRLKTHKIERIYNISVEELKNKLNLEGELVQINLCTGRTHTERENNVSSNKEVYEFVLIEQLK